MKPIVIPHNNLSTNNTGYKLNGTVTVPTHSKIFSDPYGDPRRNADETKGKRELLTVLEHLGLLLFFFQIIEGVPCVRRISSGLHLPPQFSQHCLDLVVHLMGCVLCLEDMYYILPCDPTASWTFLDANILHLLSHFCSFHPPRNKIEGF